MIDEKRAARLFRLADRMEATAVWIAGLKGWVVAAVAAAWIVLQLVDAPAARVVSGPLFLAGLVWLGGRLQALAPLFNRLVDRRPWLGIGLAGALMVCGFGLVVVFFELDQAQRAHDSLIMPASVSLPPDAEK